MTAKTGLDGEEAAIVTVKWWWRNTTKSKNREGGADAAAGWSAGRFCPALFFVLLADRAAGAGFLNLGHAAVDEQFCAGYEAAVVGGQEDDGFGDFAGGADAAQGNGGGHAGLESFELIRIAEQVISTRRFYGARADDVHADFPVFKVGGPGAGERTDRCFRGAVDAERGDAFGAGDGAVDDDGGAIAQERQGFLNGEEDALHVDAKFLIELGFGDGAKRSKCAAASVGKNNVEMAFLFFDAGEEALEVG